jgi:hypothetical protein
MVIDTSPKMATNKNEYCDLRFTQIRCVLTHGTNPNPTTQYTAIARLGAVLAVLIAASYSLRPTPTGGAGTHGVARLGNTLLGIVASLSFVLGALCSAASGYMSMWVSAHTNIRVASAARCVLGWRVGGLRGRQGCLGEVHWITYNPPHALTIYICNQAFLHGGSDNLLQCGGLLGGAQHVS